MSDHSKMWTATRGRGNSAALVTAAVQAGGTIVLPTPLHADAFSDAHPEVGVCHLQSPPPSEGPIFVDVSTVMHLQRKLQNAQHAIMQALEKIREATAPHNQGLGRPIYEDRKVVEVVDLLNDGLL